MKIGLIVNIYTISFGVSVFSVILGRQVIDTKGLRRREYSRVTVVSTLVRCGSFCVGSGSPRDSCPHRSLSEARESRRRICWENVRPVFCVTYILEVEDGEVWWRVDKFRSSLSKWHVVLRTFSPWWRTPSPRRMEPSYYNHIWYVTVVSGRARRLRKSSYRTGTGSPLRVTVLWVTIFRDDVIIQSKLREDNIVPESQSHLRRKDLSFNKSE